VDPVYNVSGECVNFNTQINISTPVEYFFAGQFVLQWNCSLFELRTTWTMTNGKGKAYNGSQWFTADDNAVGLTGNNPSCPDQNQGRANFLCAWDSYPDTHGLSGINISAPPSGPAEGILSIQRWRTYGSACVGTYRTGTTEIGFVPELEIVGFKDGDVYYYTDPVTWTNTSVTVN
jgi:hypothetical protein